jgi:hypothetical protein
MSPVNVVGRRLFLGGLGAGVGSGVFTGPWLKSLLPASTAHAAAVPKRFVVWFTPSGTIPEQFFPTGGETNFTLGRILKPIENAGLRSKMLVLAGINLGAQDKGQGSGDGHRTGMGLMLTARGLLPGDVPSGISIDQFVANQISAGTARKSLELGIKVGQNDSVSFRMCWAGAMQPIPPENDPQAAFHKVFDGFTGTAPPGERRMSGKRRSVIDSIQSDFAGMESRLGADDRTRLAGFKEGIHGIEQRLGAVRTTCAAPNIGGVSYLGDNAASQGIVDQIGEAHIQTAVMAMACDLTRVVSFQWGSGPSDMQLPMLKDDNGGLVIPAGQDHHSISHLENDPVYREKLTRVNEWYAARFVSLVSQMDAIKESNGKTLLDNSIVLWVNEISEGNSHGRDNMPYVIMGSGSGALRTGRSLKFNGDPHNKLFTSIANALDINVTSFGDPDYSGALTGLT